MFFDLKYNVKLTKIKILTITKIKFLKYYKFFVISPMNDI